MTDTPTDREIAKAVADPSNTEYVVMPGSELDVSDLRSGSDCTTTTDGDTVQH